ncbi:hypothetical protein ACJTMZ_03685 [Enterobacter sp. DN]
MAGELPENKIIGEKVMKTNQCSEGFDNPSKFRDEWDKQTQEK